MSTAIGIIAIIVGLIGPAIVALIVRADFRSAREEREYMADVAMGDTPETLAEMEDDWPELQNFIQEREARKGEQ